MSRKVSPESEIHENQVKRTSFSKSLSPGKNWKSKSTRMIPHEFVRSNPEAFEHRVVFTVPWKNSWQLWLQRDKNCVFMIKEDWDEFVDDNLLDSGDKVVFTHQGTMDFQVRIFKKDGKEVVSAPLQVTEPETEPVFHPKPESSSHQELPTPASSVVTEQLSASGGRESFAERYLLNPNNPYFEKTLSRTNKVLYVSPLVIKKYGLEFGPHSSSMYFLLPDGSRLEGFTKSYSGLYAFSGWEAVCQKYNLKQGDTVVCEFELSGRVVTAVRVHLVSE